MEIGSASLESGSGSKALAQSQNLEAALLKKVQDVQQMEGQAAVSLIQNSKQQQPQNVIRPNKVDAYA